MLEKYEPSPDFVAKVMARVWNYEQAKAPRYQWFIEWRPFRYILAGGGTLCGVFVALPVF